MQHRPWIYFFGKGQADAGSELKHFVGGKGASLGDLTRAQFNVPPGFTLSAECCQLFHQQPERWPDGLLDELRENVQRLEEITQRSFEDKREPLLVAVRSGAAESMPGMMDTVLNVGSWQTLLDAIHAVWRSWNSDRARAYRAHHKIDGLMGTAVTVQVMCPSEVAGVLFTEDPLSPARGRMLIEASPGLGEAVVLGRVTPDRYVLDKNTTSILECILAPGRHTAALDDARILGLGRLGKRVEDHFQYPCDIEWGHAQGQFWLLQARPIRFSAAAVEREKVRREEIEAARAKAVPGGTVWARFNLSEVLPEPTPMTWAIVRHFMSGRGGYGLMYRDLGFDPDAALDEDGIFDLICGRPYCNLSREPRMQYRDLPFEHNFELLKANPAKALYPQPALNPAHAGWKFWLLLPFIFFKVWRGSVKVRKSNKSFASEFVERIVPAFVSEVEEAFREDIAPLSTSQLQQRLHYWIGRTLVDFARHSLKPTALAGMAMGNLQRVLAQRLQDSNRAQALVRELVMDVKPAKDADLAAAFGDLNRGRLSKEDFLRRFGHRGNQEMELSRPRWSEEPEKLNTSGARPAVEKSDADTVNRHQIWDSLTEELKLLPHQRRVLEEELVIVHTYLGLREAAKHYLLRGYAQVRRYLVELDRRFTLAGGIFFLTLEELPLLLNGELQKEQAGSLIASRRRRRQLSLSIPVPQVLFSDDLEAIGRAPEITGAATMQGVALSAGIGEGAALVLEDPTGASAPPEPYILVCPSTDPAWSPLFAGASGLVMETGGVLSHGAIVAREYNLPAVAGIADVHRRIKTGQRLRIDGGSGKVTILA